MEKELKDGVAWLVKNWDKIPDNFKQNLRSGSYGEKSIIEGVKADEHYVILLLDRQKPSVPQSWDFDEERIGINKVGQIIWGFDSGCSCPSPWNDNYPSCYSVTKEWKQFILKDTSGFDEDWAKECLESINKIKADVKAHTAR